MTSCLITDFGTGVRIAVPTAILAAMAMAAREGVLFKGGHYLERLSAADTVVFDKTGTLTSGAPRIVRVAESATVQVKGLEYVAAARASGAGMWQVLRLHLLPNVLGPVLVFASTQVSLSIILAAGLSFLGLGVTPPAAEWGLMLNTLRQSIYVNAVVPALPGLAIFVTSMAFNLLSDGLRDAMEIRS